MMMIIILHKLLRLGLIYSEKSTTVVIMRLDLFDIHLFCDIGHWDSVFLKKD